MALLEVQGLRTRFHCDDGIVQAVRGVSLEVEAGEAVGLVGESGCGKSVLGLSIMGLIREPPGEVTASRLRLGEHELRSLDPEGLRRLRGVELAMVFQDPMTSLNPFLRISTQLTEVLRVHRGLGRGEARDHAVSMLEAVGIPGAARRLRSHSHELSGGMRQRVMIAMALLCGPQLLIADEPTTALDVTIQAQILDLIRELTHERGTALLLVTHDLGVVAGTCQRVLVMYAGRVVEEAPVEELFARPLHPYTQGLLRSVPRLDTPRQSELDAIGGQPPDLVALPPGCPYRPRCAVALEACATEDPPLESHTPESTHRVACHAARRP